MPNLRGEGALRAATTCLRLQSEPDVALRLAAPAVQGADGEQLGLGTPEFEDVPLWPAAWSRTGGTRQMLVGAECIGALTGTGVAPSAEALFENAVGVVVTRVLYVIQESSAVMAGGAPCAYRLVLAAPART